MPIYEYQCLTCGTTSENLLMTSGDEPKCNSCGSDECRQRCVDSGAAAGSHNRFLWCEVMPAEGVYDLGPVVRWIEANAAAGLRSIIGFSPKTDPSVPVNCAFTSEK